MSLTCLSEYSHPRESLGPADFCAFLFHYHLHSPCLAVLPHLLVCTFLSWHELYNPSCPNMQSGFPHCGPARFLGLSHPVIHFAPNSHIKFPAWGTHPSSPWWTCHSPSGSGITLLSVDPKLILPDFNLRKCHSDLANISSSPPWCFSKQNCPLPWWTGSLWYLDVSFFFFKRENRPNEHSH